MKKLLSLLMIFAGSLCVWAQAPVEKNVAEKTPYHFSCTYRLEAGYTQPYQHISQDTLNYVYLHGAKIGATFDFNLPHHFSIQTGVLYSFAAGTNQQHWRSISTESTQKEYMTNTIYQHTLTIPVRAYYDAQIWKKLSLCFFTGPQFQIGLAQTCKIDANLSPELETWLHQQNIRTSTYDRYQAGEYERFNCQWSIGGGLSWDRYRVQAGYDFGLCNLTPQKNAPIAEWGWTVSFVYTLK